MLFLSGQDIESAVTRFELMDQVEEIMRLYESKDFLMPVRWHLDYGGDTLLLMPCFTRELFGTKLVSLFPGNTALGKPMINALMVVNDSRTGEPLAMLNGAVLTALRTAAVGGVGVRCLSPDEPQRLGIIGAGVQGFQQARFACAAREMTRITVYDLLADKVPEFLDRLAEALPGVPIRQASTVEDLADGSDTIITATTSSEPVLPDEAALLSGKHFVSIGSYKPNMREFPKALFQMIQRLYVDTEHAFEESGDLIDPLKNGWIERERTGTLGSLLLSGADFNQARQGTTLFKSVGMALFDVGVSKLIYEKARAKGLGQEVSL